MLLVDPCAGINGLCLTAYSSNERARAPKLNSVARLFNFGHLQQGKLRQSIGFRVALRAWQKERCSARSSYSEFFQLTGRFRN